MNKKSFLASNWFGTNESARNSQGKQNSEIPLQEGIVPFDITSALNSEAPLNSFFVPGWKGESLISKDVKKFISVLDKFHKDAKKDFYHKEQLSRKLKVSIYNEFISYSEFKAINCTELDHYTTFWSELKNKDSRYRQEIDGFFDILSFRIAVVYLLKVRFILVLQDQTDTKFDIKSIFYPNSFLTNIFKTASSTELRTKAFEQNVFSWYRPSENLKDELLKFKGICHDLKITEIIKTISTKSEKILNSKTDYSHSISHKSFGLFLNNLIINFPIWLNSINQKQENRFKTMDNDIEIISTKFAGDYLESLALSHWLAQDSNKNMKWDQIICPDFKKPDFQSGLYLKTVNELQFLTFLAKIAKIQGKQPKSFISNIINSHLYNRKDSNEIQKSLTLSSTPENFSTYDRIILNLSHSPKNNPQHFLFTQISAQKKFMKDNGLIYIITSKKLFVPSQKNKIENLLQDFKVEGIINFDEVKGKGEVGSYIYIFSNRARKSLNPNKKHSCLNFRFDAHLETFQEFTKLTKLSQDFFENNLKDTPPLYQRTEDQVKLEFFQDAIVNGQLIHSSSKDSSKVTHPLFFKKLMSLCNSLDYFFDIQNVDFNDVQEEDSLFNFSQSFKREESPYTIIVDQRIKDNIKLEVISTNILEAKSYEYGHALCSYFYAYPKWPNLCTFTIKEYFESSIGKQIVNLTFSNEIRKIKGNLNKILIPKYFISKENELPEHIMSGLKLLSLGPNDILTLHPTELERNYQNIKLILPTIVKTYPAKVLELLSNFKRSAYNAIEIIGCANKTTSINFNNPILKTPLLLSKTYPIYPDNKDVFIEFNSDALEMIHRPLLKLKRVTQKKSDYTSYGLELYTDGQQILTIYSDEYMINFIEFLLQNVVEVPISKILQGIQVPQLDDLKSILSSYKLLTKTLTELNSQLPKDFDQLINSTILNSN